MNGQILAHLWGDYLLQSDWMAQNKRKSDWACTVHAALYTLCFLPVLLTGTHAHPGWCLFTICGTHALIDRYGLARYPVWAKNWMGPLSRMETLPEAVRRWTENGFGPTATREELDRIDADRRQITCNLPWADCSVTGYAPSRPVWLSTWLFIIADNTLHLTCNYIALRFL